MIPPFEMSWLGWMVFWAVFDVCVGVVVLLNVGLWRVHLEAVDDA